MSDEYSRENFLSDYRRFITEHWGPRCDTQEPGCCVCVAWALYDTIAVSFFEDDEIDSA